MASPQLPDPTADLHWSAFRGAIHDIFAANAQKHPERIAVHETASSNSPDRRFTYQQINESSNVLAHHLVHKGVQRGEVVMIYAHRGVDLVVAVQGVLKAGATFSVIDPQYPPDRQIIYLDVAQPRALVVIEKASELTGGIAQQVQDFIKEKLDLRTSIPALKLEDNGTLKGGAVSGHDCLQEQQSSKEKSPGIVVGPDSVPTLSFTSGSEGRPKGVQGRHFSLAYYFDWMGERFNLSEKDNFGMLSGIAHDPIQRDMFTPLFFGAKIVIPSPEDIAFDRLAAWMAKNKITVTHFTPAMGQIMLGSQEPKILSLHHAFFVGDLLLKRDCRRLRDLAPNVNIVNMYGTTETQRAVSFFEIPSKNESPDSLTDLPDVIPAGRGMKDVQLLVVDRENTKRICDVGQVGEIYVRAGGLAEGYLGSELADSTKKKFVQNWFVDPAKWMEQDKHQANGAAPSWRQFYKGPRDRLYRSGDLGRYTRTGDVECTGRADDQVKIRGFRIELGEIDTHLSRHELVQQNCTLVRRDKNEEQQLVSYIVPNRERWEQWAKERDPKQLTVDSADESMIALLKRFKKLSDDVRDYLKTKLPHYAIPTRFVPLARMPLNPNGKVDKKALPFPEESEFAAATARRPSQDLLSRSETEKKLAEIWAKTTSSGFTARSIADDASFFDLGGNSISAQQMLAQVRKQWSGVNLPITAIFQSPTLKKFAREIDTALDPQGLRLDAMTGDEPQFSDYYSNWLPDLVEQLPSNIKSAMRQPTQETTVFLTGASGFLGAFLVRELLSRSYVKKVIILVRGKDKDEAYSRIKRTMEAYGIWSTEASTRLECVVGDLSKQPTLGVDAETWSILGEEVDLIVHNGAQVHWVLPASSLKATNVLSTLSAINLCATGKAKTLCFVSSTSVLDHDHYLELSERRSRAGRGNRGISEEDGLDASGQGLPTGYGQTKWLSEKLMHEARRRGLSGSIIRAGYILGDSKSGTTNTDDFLIRMLKGSIQTGCRPDITNRINMCPVDHVARLVIAAALHPPQSTLGVCHVNSHPRLTFNEYLSCLEAYGYDVPQVGYPEWKAAAEKYVSSGKEDFALLGLYHMVTNDLPGNTKAPELEDIDAVVALDEDAKELGQGEYDMGRSAVTEDVVGVYLAYLIARGFLPAPSEHGKRALPKVDIGEEQAKALEGIGGRGGMSVALTG